ncbi:hypothetical protein Tco_0231964 [Tanacetum coccineum]
MEVFIGGLPRSIEGNVAASKPQTLEEAITITQRLMDQVTKHNSVQGTNDHKRKFDDRRTFTNNNNYNRNNNNSNRNNDHQQQQQNRRQETVRAYAAAPTKNSRTSSKTRNLHVDITPKTNRGIGYDKQTGQYKNQRAFNVAMAKENVGTQELEAYYMYMAKIQEVSPDAADNSGPIFDVEPLQKVHTSDDDYNVFTDDRHHLEQPKSINDPYLIKQDDIHIIPDSLDMCNNGEEADHDAQIRQNERELLASLIEKMKAEIDENKSYKMETKDMISSCSETKYVLSKEDLKGTRIQHGFKRAFMSLFGQDDDTFTSTMLFNVDQLQKQLDKYVTRR